MPARPRSAIRSPARLAAVRATGLLDTAPEERFDDLLRLGAAALHAPIATLSLVDRRREFLKGTVGLPQPWSSGREVSLSDSLSKHVVRSARPLVLADLASHAASARSGIRAAGIVAYAGVPLRGRDGSVVGAVAAMDTHAHPWTEAEVMVLERIAQLVGHDVLRSTAPPAAAQQGRIRDEAMAFQALIEQTLAGIALVRDRRLIFVNPRLAEILGYTEEELLAMGDVLEVVAREDRERVAGALEPRPGGGSARFQARIRGVRKDGRHVQLETHCLATGSRGAPAVIVTALDVTEQAAAQDALVEAERRFRGIFDGTFQFIWLLSPDGVVLEANRASLEFGGLARDEVVGRPFPEARWWTLSPATPERLRDAVRRAAGGEFVRHEVDVRGAGDRVATIDFSVRPIRDDSGAVALLIPEGRDISPRKAAEAALQRSEERLRLVVRAANEVIWEWDVASGAVLWSEGAAVTFRRAPPEILPTIEWWYENLHPEDREAAVAGLHEVENGTEGTWSAEYRFRRGDGTYAVILDRGFVARDARGHALRMIGSMLDITERRRTEDSQRFLARASAILNSSLECEATLPALARMVVPAVADYCLVDVVEGGSVRRVAAAHATPAKESLLGIGETYPPGEPVATAIRERRPVLIAGDPPRALAAVDPDPARRNGLGELDPQSTLVAPLLGHGAPLGALVLATAESGRRLDPLDLLLAEDLARRITLALENASLYAQAQRAIRARERILGVVSHDLRNPLSTIRIAASLLAADGKPASVKRAVAIIERSAEAMNQMIADLLDLSTIDAGGFALAPAATEVSALLGAVEEGFAQLAQDAGVALVCASGERVATAWVDARQVVRVLSNLVANALKFTAAGGAIRVRAERVEEGVCFSVADTGRGIPPELLPHVFDRYWQAHHADRRGAGLGLAIARGIVEAHGGRIWAESTPGEGSTFSFTVPVDPDHVGAAAGA